jgi:PAS domain S-box-containing protein
LDFPISKKLHYSKNQQKVVHFEQYYPKDNLWFEISAYPSKKGLSVYLKDITNQKLYLEQIEESNMRFEKVTEATNDAIWDWDIENETLFMGGGFKTLFGHNPKKLSESIDSWSDNIHPEDKNLILSELDKTLEKPDTNFWQGEYRFKKKDGKYAYVVDRGVIIRNKKGKSVRMVGAVTDLTKQKKYEESLKNLNEI